MIKQAIIPLAGQGTRLLPLTSVFAKELLPINGKPGIEYIIEECIEAGIKEIIFIISKKKEMIKTYFNKDTFYKKIIKKKKDKRIINEFKKIKKYKKMETINKLNFFIKDVIEKPDIKKAPSNNAVIGRYILTSKIFNKLKNQKKGKGGEIHITDAIRRLIKDGNKFIGHNFSGKYLDCGTMQGYIKSSVEISKI